MPPPPPPPPPPLPLFFPSIISISYWCLVESYEGHNLTSASHWLCYPGCFQAPLHAAGKNRSAQLTLRNQLAFLHTGRCVMQSGVCWHHFSIPLPQAYAFWKITWSSNSCIYTLHCFQQSVRFIASFTRQSCILIGPVFTVQRTVAPSFPLVIGVNCSHHLRLLLTQWRASLHSFLQCIKPGQLWAAAICCVVFVKKKWCNWWYHQTANSFSLA